MCFYFFGYFEQIKKYNLLFRYLDIIELFHSSFENYYTKSKLLKIILVDLLLILVSAKKARFLLLLSAMYE